MSLTLNDVIEDFTYREVLLMRVTQERVTNYNDLAHQWSHVEDVANLGIELAEKLDLDVKPFVYAAMIHDYYSSEDRANHHTLSGEWAEMHLPFYIRHFGTEEKRKEMVALVAGMCRTHRASYKGDYANIYEEAFAVADRGIPEISTIPSLILRAGQYYRDHHRDATSEEVFTNAHMHLHEKYGSDGYARYPKLLEKMFADQVSLFRKAVDDLTLDDVKKELQEQGIS